MYYLCVLFRVLNMNLSTFTAISPVDGRYRDKVEKLSEYFSEFALMRYRVNVEIEYFIFLSNHLPQLKPLEACKTKVTTASLPLQSPEAVTTASLPLQSPEAVKTIEKALREIYLNFSLEDAQRIKEIEKRTNHDVKAVEYFVKEHFDTLGLAEYKEFVHFGLTSQDINNTAIPLAIRDAMKEVYFPLIKDIINRLKKYAGEWDDIAMLAKTHGQPATPTRLGKEIRVFIYRLERQLEPIDIDMVTVKFGGAVGNFNAHQAAFPQYDWPLLSDDFIFEHFKLEREEWTTQISNYDNLAALFDGLSRINTIFIDMCRDIWSYISMDYFKLKILNDEVGSSAMPHKVNPIDFENAEGNLGLANAILNHLSTKLPVSRLQRDLTDSTVLRNIGVPLAHIVIAFKSMIKGLEKLLVNKSVIANDLNSHWEVVAEAVQTILRREKYPQPYETLKQLTRVNNEITEQSIHQFIDSLNLNEIIKAELKAITPQNYVGVKKS